MNNSWQQETHFSQAVNAAVSVEFFEANMGVGAGAYGLLACAEGNVGTMMGLMVGNLEGRLSGLWGGFGCKGFKIQTMHRKCCSRPLGW